MPFVQFAAYGFAFVSDKLCNISAHLEMHSPELVQICPALHLGIQTVVSSTPSAHAQNGYMPLQNHHCLPFLIDSRRNSHHDEREFGVLGRFTTSPLLAIISVSSLKSL